MEYLAKINSAWNNFNLHYLKKMLPRKKQGSIFLTFKKMKKWDINLASFFPFFLIMFTQNKFSLPGK